jgi:hypothetical protein
MLGEILCQLGLHRWRSFGVRRDAGEWVHTVECVRCYVHRTLRQPSNAGGLYL